MLNLNAIFRHMRRGGRNRVHRNTRLLSALFGELLVCLFVDSFHADKRWRVQPGFGSFAAFVRGQNNTLDIVVEPERSLISARDVQCLTANADELSHLVQFVVVEESLSRRVLENTTEENNNTHQKERRRNT